MDHYINQSMIQMENRLYFCLWVVPKLSGDTARMRLRSTRQWSHQIEDYPGSISALEVKLNSQWMELTKTMETVGSDTYGSRLWHLRLIPLSLIFYFWTFIQLVESVKLIFSSHKSGDIRRDLEEELSLIQMNTHFHSNCPLLQNVDLSPSLMFLVYSFLLWDGHAWNCLPVYIG
jgi:hypothetical protein